MASDHAPDSVGTAAAPDLKSRSPPASRVPSPSPPTAARADAPTTQLSPDGVPGSAKKPRLLTPSLQASPSRAEDGDAGPQLSAEEKTPSQQHPRTPRAPAAPSKSGSSSYERAHPSPAVRSLTPIFNGCTGAAERARQMGGQYAVKLRRPQRTASGSLPPSDNNSPVDSFSVPAPGGSGSAHKRSRSRSVLSELLARPSSMQLDRWPAPLAPSRGSPGLGGVGPSRGAAAVAAAVAYRGAAGAAPTPAPSPLGSLHVGALTTQLGAEPVAARAGEAAGEAAGAWQARRPAGRPQAHGQGSEAQPQGWLKSAAFKPR